MSAFMSIAPIIERTAAENSLAEQAGRTTRVVGARRPRFAMAALLRRAAAIELGLAARLERRPSGRHLATA